MRATAVRRLELSAGQPGERVEVLLPLTCRRGKLQPCVTGVRRAVSRSRYGIHSGERVLPRGHGRAARGSLRGRQADLRVAYASPGRAKASTSATCFLKLAKRTLSLCRPSAANCFACSTSHVVYSCRSSSSDREEMSGWRAE